MLVVAVGGLAAGTGAAALLGKGVITAGTYVISNPWTIPTIQFGGGLIEGSVKSIYGPDPESSFSILMNPISDKSMNAAQLFWNSWTLLKGSNPLPNPHR